MSQPRTPTRHLLLPRRSADLYASLQLFIIAAGSERSMTRFPSFPFSRRPVAVSLPMKSLARSERMPIQPL